MKKFATLIWLAVVCLCLATFAACQKPCKHASTKWIVDSEPTCTEAGYRHQFCLDCGETVVQNQTITALGHALERGVCSRCGYEHVTEGLAFSEILDEETSSVVAYAVSGIGQSDDSYVVVPNEYNGFPVTTVAASAFAQCGGVTDVVLPQSVLRVESYAFKDCVSLTNVYLPEGLRYLGWYAFDGCVSLAEVEVPQSVTSIGKYAFDKCSSLAKISVAEGNASYKAVDGNLYDKNCSTLLRYAIGKSDDSFEVPASVKTLDERCFADSNLKSVTFASDSKIASIGSYVFANCKKLASFTMPDTVNVLGEYVFAGCKLLGNVKLSDGVITLNNGLFSECSALKSVEIPRRVRVISAYAFVFCSSLQNITVAEGNTYFKSLDGNLYTFDGTKMLKYAAAKTEKQFVLPRSVTEIGEFAFERCNSLEKVVVSSNVTVVEKNAFYNCDVLTVYCEAVYQPDSWNEYWLYHPSGEIRAEWGYGN